MNKKLLFNRIWESPTLMTWLSYSTKALTLFGVLPLVLKSFSPGDVVLWYLFATIISLQSIADFGFRQTFSRMISYAFGGADEIKMFVGNEQKVPSEDLKRVTGPNITLLSNLVSTMNYIYIRLTGFLLLIMSVLGTWSLIKPINNSDNTYHSWLSWLIVLLVSVISFYGKIYLNFLEGLNKIALVRRVETLTSIGSIISSIIVLIAAPSLLNLIIVNQVWVLIVTFRDWYLCRDVNDGLYNHLSLKQPFDRDMFNRIWHPAWRSGISGLMSVGLTNITGIIYAQVGSAGSVAAYLLALRIINQIKDVSMAPFYSRIPYLAILRVKNDIDELGKVVRRGMFLSHMVFVCGVIIVGLFTNNLLSLINSKVEFVDPNLWVLLGFAFYVHRFGAMHIQVYMSTNHIISHIADGVSGIIYIVSTFLLIKYIGVYAIPAGMLISYLGFYSWYAAKASYSSLRVNFWSFELSASFMPLMAMIIYSFYQLLKSCAL